MTKSAFDFSRMIVKVGSRVRYLLHQATQLEPQQLSKELAECQKALRNIYGLARRDDIDLAPYYAGLVDIETTLRQIEAGGPPVGPAEKIALFIDGANLNAMTAYDQLRTKIDFAKFLNYFGHNAIILRAFYYLAVDPKDKSSGGFLVWLKRNGYQVVSKPMKKFDDGGQKGNLDIEIAIDMLELADKVDRVVLISGDGDFAPLLKRIGRKGARTQVISYWGGGKGPTAPELLNAADTFVDLQDILPIIRRTD